MPFKHPKQKHRRTQNPPVYSDYRKYKPFLQKEFVNHCIYCQTPDTLNNITSFGVDHYKPKSIFPTLERVYSNLYYSCNKCNNRKRSFWPSSSLPDVFIPNPCDYIMTDHMKFNKSNLILKSEAGEFTIELLQLNSEESKNFRITIYTAVITINDKIQSLTVQLSKLKNMLCSLVGSNLNKAKKEISSIENDLEILEVSLDGLLGLR